MHWETEKFVWLALLEYSLYCDGLEANPQYLWGVTVLYVKQQRKEWGRKGKLVSVHKYIPNREMGKMPE